jgi:hypothetical protein
VKTHRVLSCKLHPLLIIATCFPTRFTEGKTYLENETVRLCLCRVGCACLWCLWARASMCVCVFYVKQRSPEGTNLWYSFTAERRVGPGVNSSNCVARTFRLEKRHLLRGRARGSYRLVQKENTERCCKREKQNCKHETVPKSSTFWSNFSYCSILSSLISIKIVRNIKRSTTQTTLSMTA